MQIVSWNIQAAKGVDKVVDVERIARVTKEFADAEIICFQEVEQVLGMAGQVASSSESQAESLARYFPEHKMFFGPAVDRMVKVGRARFGNMILSRLPVHNVFMHKLPQPADPLTRNMARQAIEILVDYNNQPLRILTTHLEFFATAQRTAQVEYLRHYIQETQRRAAAPSPSGVGTYTAPPETDMTIVCGDFNLTPGSDDYAAMINSDEAGSLHDAWRIVHGDEPHAPTCGIHDREQWADGEHCRDFFFVSTQLCESVSGIVVNTETAASDHQPIKLQLT